jgi:hypothetical protein
MKCDGNSPSRWWITAEIFTDGFLLNFSDRLVLCVFQHIWRINEQLLGLLSSNR